MTRTDFLKLINELSDDTLMVIDGYLVTVKEAKEGIKKAEERSKKVRCDSVA